jgi:hypothetical protein
VRCIATLTLSLGLVLSLTTVGHLLAQDQKETKDQPKTEEPKKESAKPSEPAKEPSKAEESKGQETKKAEVKTEAEETPPPIPPEVQAKLDAARRAVAEAIVAAQDAGLVETTIDPPPILDILITGRANDRRELKKVVEKKDLQVGVSPEVFGAWYTGYGKMEGVDPAQKNVRIVQPSKGLKDYYDQRAAIFSSLIDSIRKSKTSATPEPAKTEPSAKDQPKETPKEAPKAEETKKAEANKEESTKDQPK